MNFNRTIHHISTNATNKQVISTIRSITDYQVVVLSNTYSRKNNIRTQWISFNYDSLIPQSLFDKIKEKIETDYSGVVISSNGNGYYKNRRIKIEIK